MERTAIIEDVKFYPLDPDASYRWVLDLVFPWLKDEDGLPRLEHGHGKTAREAFKLSEKMMLAYEAAGDLAPDEYPPNL